MDIPLTHLSYTRKFVVIFNIPNIFVYLEKLSSNCLFLVLLQNQTSEAIQKAKEDLDTYREHYDNLLAEDKVRAIVLPIHQCNRVAA